MASLTDIVSHAPEVLFRVLKDEAVLVLPDRGRIKVLNEVGARIWELADGTRSLASVVEVVCSEFDVSPDQAKSDTLVFVAQLIVDGALVLRE